MFQFLNQPILNALILLYNLLFSNLGLAIIALTALLRLAMVPLMTPQLKASEKMKEINPELKKLQEKFKNDKQKLMQAQMELYKKHGVNPASGCLPTIIQFVLLFSLNSIFNQIVRPGTAALAVIAKSLYPFVAAPTSLNLSFLYFNLAKPDLILIPGFFPLPGILVILAALLQFLSMRLMTPTVKAEEKMVKKTEEKSDDMAVAMQKQMLYFLPLLTIVFGYTLPSGVVLYWLVLSLITLIQQLLINKEALSAFFQKVKGIVNSHGSK